MKKLLSLLLSMSLVFSLAACSGGTASFSENGTSEPSEASTESEEPSSSETPAESTEPKEETGGTLEGFERIGGMHYPVYSFSLPDGSVCRKMDMEVSLEDSAAQEEVEKILRRKYPRKVKVRYSRRNPEKSRCIYL